MIRCLLSIAMVSLFAFLARADWPSFLGGASRADSAKFTPPLQWSPDTAIAWETPLPGHGQSSPVVIGNRIYVTAVEGPMKNKNVVVCIDATTGQSLWKQDFPSSLQVENNVYTSRAAPTPVADASGVCAFFESGNLVALDLAGDVRWERDLIKDYGKYEGRFGLGGSLVQTPEQVMVVADNEGPSYIAAFDKQTGKTLWKTNRRSRVSWSSPMLVSIGGKKQIVISSSGSVDGYDPSNGKLLWTFEDVGGNNVPSTIPVQDGTFLVGASPGRNGEAAEGAKQSNLLMKVDKIDSGYQPTVVWRNTEATSSFGSPMVYKGHAYFTNRAGVVFCIDAATGETQYTARMPESNWATPIGIGEHVFFFGKGGTTLVIETGPEKNFVEENRLWNSTAAEGRGGFSGEIQYGVAPLQNGFIVRTGTRLFLIGEPPIVE